MRDNKDATTSAKGADDWIAARHGAVHESAMVADLGEFRAANMADHKTSLEPKAEARGEETGIGSSRERAAAGWQSGLVLNPESVSEGPITDASATEARIATGPDSSAPAAPATRHEQGLWNSGHDADVSQAPAAVQATIAREAAGRDLHTLSAKVENGRTIYDARIARPGDDELRLKVAEDGSIVWRNDLKEQATAPLIQPTDTSSGSTSTTVAPAGPMKAADEQQAIGHASGSGSSGSSTGADPSHSTPADQSRQDPSTARANAEVDEAKMSSLDTSDTSGNGVHDAHAVPAATDTDGWLGLGSGNRVAIEEVPKAVKDAILREADGKAISRIDRDSEQGKTIYKARIRVNDGKDLKLKFAEDGTVVSRK